MKATNQTLERGRLRHEALRGRLLKVSQRCFAEWSRVLTLAELDGFVKWIVDSMPPEIGWLERDDGLQSGGATEADDDPAVVAALDARQMEGPCLRCGQTIDNLGALPDLYEAMTGEFQQLLGMFPELERSEFSTAASLPPNREDEFVREMNQVLQRSALRHEALRRRLLRITQRCFPEWSKVMTLGELESLGWWLCNTMPSEIWRLKLGDGKPGMPSLEAENNPAVIAGALAAQAEGHCTRCGQMLDVGEIRLDWNPGMPIYGVEGAVILPAVKGRPAQRKRRGVPEKRDYTKPW